jgi:hypothetical protein
MNYIKLLKFKKMSNILPQFSIVDTDHNINLIVKEKHSSGRSSKSLDLYNENTNFEDQLLSSTELSSDTKANDSLDDKIQTEKYIQNILGITKKNKQKKNSIS